MWTMRDTLTGNRCDRWLLILKLLPMGPVLTLRPTLGVEEATVGLSRVSVVRLSLAVWPRRVESSRAESSSHHSGVSAVAFYRW